MVSHGQHALEWEERKPGTLVQRSFSSAPLCLDFTRAWNDFVFAEICIVILIIHFILLFSRQGKLRLQKWYTTLPDKEKKKIIREIVQIILSRNQKTSSFVDWKDLKLVYKRYASLYFCCAIEDQDNELLTLEVVHRYVELLDRYFGNVCELDIIFNFEKAYFILDEFIIGGEVQETSKRSAVKAIEESDMLQETVEEYMNKPAF
ncbi:ap-1 complex subunit sigma-3 [Limosa lapponica baueri]|uniref:Ap-1 complex subunit sigma-3 n=1 Tax=Limosa lapponica baueri TaxID=1758121 RepID=A0A2I0U760_LIMLA|nr:ap-1 complex subunit sigma-3 [Limosa lapponica baueri]